MNPRLIYLVLRLVASACVGLAAGEAIDREHLALLDWVALYLLVGAWTGMVHETVRQENSEQASACGVTFLFSLGFGVAWPAFWLWLLWLQRRRRT